MLGRVSLWVPSADGMPIPALQETRPGSFPITYFFLGNRLVFLYPIRKLQSVWDYAIAASGFFRTRTSL